MFPKMRPAVAAADASRRFTGSQWYAVAVVLSGTLIIIATQGGPASWENKLQDTALFLNAAAFNVLGPVASACGFLSRRRLTRGGSTLHVRSPRTVRTVLGARFSIDIGFLWMGFAIVAAVAFVIGSPFQGSGPIWVVLLQSMAALAFCYGLGWLVGSLIPWSWGIVVAAPLPYVFAFIANYAMFRIGQPRVLWLAPYLESRMYPGNVPSIFGFSILTLYAVAAAGTLLALGSLRLFNRLKRRSIARCAIACSIVAAGSALVIAVPNDPDIFHNTRTDVVCANDDLVTACLFEENNMYLEAWASSAGDVESLFAGNQLLEGLRFVQAGMAPQSPLDIQVPGPVNRDRDSLTTEMVGQLMGVALRACSPAEQLKLQEELELSLQSGSSLRQDFLPDVIGEC